MLSWIMDFIILVKTHLTHLLVYHFQMWQSVNHQVLPDKWCWDSRNCPFFLRLWSSSLEFNSNWIQSRGTEFNQQQVRALCAATLQIKLKLVMDFAKNSHPALFRISSKKILEVAFNLIPEEKGSHIFEINHERMYSEEADPFSNYLVWKYQQGVCLFVLFPLKKKKTKVPQKW